MSRGADIDLGTTGNRYCERVGLASVPCVEDVLDRDEVSLFHLMVVALLERGRPMTVEQIAERLTEAGAVARSGDMVLALKRAWHGREPVFRDPRGGLGLNLSSSELDRMMWHAGLRPPRFQPPEPPLEPAQPETKWRSPRTSSRRHSMTEASTASRPTGRRRPCSTCDSGL